MKPSLFIAGAMALCLAGGAVAGGTDPLEAMRQSGNLPAERDHVWALFAGLTRPVAGQPVFQTWHGEDELFGSAPVAAKGIQGFSRSFATAQGDVPVIAYTLYNDAAYQHIVRYGLNRKAALKQLQKTGARDGEAAADRKVPDFPAAAMVPKTAWWPVAANGLTALPVWDPEHNPASPMGNPYTNWQRVVAVDPQRDGAPVRMDFVGRSFPDSRHVGLGQFYSITLDAGLAQRMMKDDETRKAAIIALGRPLQSGDHLALVSANLASREIADWIWAAFWWHDRADGAFAAGRPALAAPWGNYLMQTAFDAQKPAAPDGGAHVSFNPWLEGRFPDGGHGGGGTSNCMACHQRASYPAKAFLPVTRGASDYSHDPAFAPGQLRTSSLWSLALHAKP